MDEFFKNRIFVIIYIIYIIFLWYFYFYEAVMFRQKSGIKLLMLFNMVSLDNVTWSLIPVPLDP